MNEKIVTSQVGLLGKMIAKRLNRYKTVAPETGEIV